MAKATDKRKFMNMLWESSESNDGVFHNTVMDMAWSLHVIAEMLMEQNGYINTHEYMVGKPEHIAEQTENCSEIPNNCEDEPQTDAYDSAKFSHNCIGMCENPKMHMAKVTDEPQERSE